MVSFAQPPIPPSPLSPKPDTLPGVGSIWRHKKGTFYKVLVVSRHTEDPDVWLVTYQPSLGGEAWTRAYKEYRNDEWPGFADEGRFEYISGPRTVADEPKSAQDEEVRDEMLQLLDNVSASAQNMLNQFAPQMKEEDILCRRREIRQARELCDILLRGDGPGESDD